MTVYKPARSRFWQYDFIYKKTRYHGSTGQETRRAAEAVERKLRLDAAEGRLGSPAELTFDEAAGRWWLEVGQHLATAADLDRRLERLVGLIGKDVKLAHIDGDVIARAVQARRGQTYKKSAAKGAKEYAVKNGTVNADVVDLARRILLRARKTWGARGLPEIDWKALRLAEPAPEMRLYSSKQQAAWVEECDPVAAAALRMLLRYGLRLSELFFPPDAVDVETEHLAIAKRKKDVPHLIPLAREDVGHLAARAGRAKAAGLPTVWFEQGEDEDGEPLLIPLTYYGLQARLRTAAKRAGIALPRVIHGARHHAGTTLLRTSRNLRLTQQLLGHRDLKSTQRYAHILTDDLRDALDPNPRNSPEADTAETEIVVPKQRRKKT